MDTDKLEIVEWVKITGSVNSWPMTEEDMLLDMHGDINVGWLDHNGMWRDSNGTRIPEPYAWANPSGLYRKDNP